MKITSLVRGSDEDFRNIFSANTPDEAWEEVKNYCNCLVYTANDEGVFVRTPYFSGKFPVRRITPVSTIGAGDNFNAGIITSIHRKNIRREQLERLTRDEWSEVIETAVAFATHVCLSYENYISPEFAKELNKHIEASVFSRVSLCVSLCQYLTLILHRGPQRTHRVYTEKI